MKIAVWIASGIFVASFAAVSAPAEAKTMKECAAQWQAMKAANQTTGLKYRDFSKQCMSEGAAPAPETKTAAPPPAETKAPPPPPPPAGTNVPAPGAKPVSPGRAAMVARERACGAEWKAEKAAGKIPAGMKWPQYWSACDKRKKAEGM
jgi:hypothetical protein